jgi:hypothetical protein
MYNKEKNNTSTAIYPKCHHTKNKECLVPILISPFLFLSSFYMLFLSSLSSGHSFIYIHMSKQSGSYLLPDTTCMFVMVRNDSHVHQVELKKRRRKEKKKKMSSVFTFLGMLLPVARLSFIRSLSFLSRSRLP